MSASKLVRVLLKNDDPTYYSEELPPQLDINQRNVGPGRMKQFGEKINEMPNVQQDMLLDTPLNPPVIMDRETGVMSSRRRGMAPMLPEGMSAEDYRKYRAKLDAMMPKEPAPGKDFMSRLRSKIRNRGTIIETGEPMVLAWRLLKQEDTMQTPLDQFSGVKPKRRPAGRQMTFRPKKKPPVVTPPAERPRTEIESEFARQKRLRQPDPEAAAEAVERGKQEVMDAQGMGVAETCPNCGKYTKNIPSWLQTNVGDFCGSALGGQCRGPV